MMVVRKFAAVLVSAAMLMAVPAFAATKVTVNGVAISDVQISQRVKLLGLEGGGGSKAATDQLIKEAVQLTEAKRLGIEVSDAQVDNSVLNVARNLKMSPDKLKQVLTANGVSLDTLEARLRATLAWNAVVQQVVNPQVQISQVDLEQQAKAKLTSADSYDYVLKEVIFIGGNRAGPANKYRSQFKGCDSAVQLSTGFTDAAVVDVGRRHATQMPEPVAKELAGLNIGGITKPRSTDKGLSMYAVCGKEAAQDLTFVTDDLRQEAGNKAAAGQADKYLADLTAKARIVYN